LHGIVSLWGGFNCLECFLLSVIREKEKEQNFAALRGNKKEKEK